MKKLPANIPTEPATTTPNRNFKFTAPAVAGGAEIFHPLTNEQLLRVGAIYTELQMASLIGDMEQPVAKQVMAGIVATLHAVLPSKQFRDVMIQWEVDAIQLSEFLELAQVNTTNNTIEA